MNPAPVPVATARAYSDLIHAALLLPADARPVRVSAAALAQLDIFRDRIERALRADGELAGIQDWGNKLPGAVCRIAGIFHGLIYAAKGDPAEHGMDAETMLCAIAIGEYLIEHAKATFFQTEADTATGFARRLLTWITEERLTEFSWRDAFNHLRGSVHRTDEIAEPINLLQEHGYIRERAIERLGPGRKPSPRYEINPLLLTHNTHNSQNQEADNNSAHSAHCAGGDGP